MNDERPRLIELNSVDKFGKLEPSLRVCEVTGGSDCFKNW